MQSKSGLLRCRKGMCRETGAAGYCTAKGCAGDVVGLEVGENGGEKGALWCLGSADLVVGVAGQCLC